MLVPWDITSSKQSKIVIHISVFQRLTVDDYSPAKGDFLRVIRMILHFTVLIVFLFILHQFDILAMSF